MDQNLFRGMLEATFATFFVLAGLVLRRRGVHAALPVALIPFFGFAAEAVRYSLPEPYQRDAICLVVMGLGWLGSVAMLLLALKSMRSAGK